jgi:hypothetical protein
MPENLNPYAAPNANTAHVEIGGVAELTRRDHLHTEVSIQAVGRLYLLGCVLILLAFVSIFIASMAEIRDGSISLISLLPAALWALGLCTAYGAAGFGLRKFKPWARIVATIIAAIGLIGFPIGTIIGGYILYLMWNKKGRTIFTAAYLDVIAATPHIKYKTSIAIWIILGIILLLVAAAFVLPLPLSRGT